MIGKIVKIIMGTHKGKKAKIVYDKNCYDIYYAMSDEFCGWIGLYEYQFEEVKNDNK